MKLPEDFKRETKRLMGSELYGQLLRGLDEEPTVSIRLNPLKCKLEEVQIPLESGKVAWCPTGFYLKERPNFTFDPLFHAGVYYVQEASSMFIDHVLRSILPESPVQMLDLCAAPGGKSTAARALLPAGSVLFTNEPMRQRVQILSENIQKSGYENVIVTNNFAADYRKAGLQFDVVLCDVPCSGEGMFRKEAVALADWSLQNVEKCRRLQREIVADIWPCLKPGGLMIYSTCTFNVHENEENVAWIAEELGAEFVPIEVQADWQITGSLIDEHPVYRFIPGKSRGEGLFMAVLRKRGDKVADSKVPSWKDLRSVALKRLNVVYDGVKEAERRGKQLVPDHSEALSAGLDMEKYPVAAVDYRQAVAYLRKEAVVLPPETPKGIVLLTYQNAPIGFAKNVGNRANNLYPQEWRIKSTHIPELKEIIKKI
ncbi:MAG: hypothetical protein IJV27_02180 [Prevotella sp.]|nr:hypothetical protein [Prevotella sp.]